MQIGLHADALDSRSHSVLERGYSDWAMYADFPPRAYNRETRLNDGPAVDMLAEARKWGRSALSDQRVDRVEIGGVQEHPGELWRPGRHVETVTRQQMHDESVSTTTQEILERWGEVLYRLGGPDSERQPSASARLGVTAGAAAHEVAGRLAELTGREVQTALARHGRTEGS
jgi:hypothetical protein